MRRKIEVTMDNTDMNENTPEIAPDAGEPEFGNHVNIPGSESVSTASAESSASAGASAKSTGASDDGANAYIVALQAEIEELRANKEEAEKRVLYTQAEFQNYRRRKEEEIIGLSKFANAELIKSLLPVLDNFERALQAAEQTRNFDALIGGVSGTMKQLQTLLQKAGATPIEAVGQEFDPNYHEAIGRVEGNGQPSNTVAEEVQKGYLMHDRVLRPSLVRVVE